MEGGVVVHLARLCSDRCVMRKPNLNTTTHTSQDKRPSKPFISKVGLYPKDKKVLLQVPNQESDSISI